MIVSKTDSFYKYMSIFYQQKRSAGREVSGREPDVRDYSGDKHYREGGRRERR